MNSVAVMEDEIRDTSSIATDSIKRSTIIMPSLYKIECLQGITNPLAVYFCDPGFIFNTAATYGSEFVPVVRILKYAIAKPFIHSFENEINPIIEVTPQVIKKHPMKIVRRVEATFKSSSYWQGKD